MAVIALGVVAIAIVATAGILVMTSHPAANLTNDSTSSSYSTMCEVPVEGAGVFLHIVADSTQQPLADISIHAVPTATSCFGASRPAASTYTANATGWISLDVSDLQANYYFETSLVYAGRNYSFILPQGPTETTNATLSLPSGTLGISLCWAYPGPKTCFPYNESATTNTSTQTVNTETWVSSKLRTSITTGTWNFTVLINTNSPVRGQPVQLVATLTNIGPANQTIANFVEPYINPGVYAANGSEVWAWDPPQVTWPSWTIASGQTLSQDVTIPTTQLNAGQTYNIEVVPLSIESVGNLTVTMQFSVGR